MSFDLKHWNNPRQTIATKYKDNDYGYTMHGAKVVSDVLSFIDKPASTLKNCTILDYGCGTGRMTTILSFLFLEAYGFDPNKECIEMAKSDIKKVDFPCSNLRFSVDVPEGAYDYTCSVSVLEHLNEKDFLVAMTNIAKLTRIGAVLWYSPTKNPHMKHFLDDISKNTNGIRTCYIPAEKLKAGLEKMGVRI